MVFTHLLLFSHSVMSKSLPPHGLQHTRLLCPSLSPWVCSNSSPLSQWCHPTVSSSTATSPPALNLSQHEGLFWWVSSSHQVAKLLELQLQHHSFQSIFRVDFCQDWLVWSPCSSRDSQGSSPALQFKNISSLVLCLLYCLALISIHDCWKNHSLDYTDFCWQSDIFAF